MIKNNTSLLEYVNFSNKLKEKNFPAISDWISLLLPSKCETLIPLIMSEYSSKISTDEDELRYVFNRLTFSFCISQAPFWPSLGNTNLAFSLSSPSSHILIRILLSSTVRKLLQLSSTFIYLFLFFFLNIFFNSRFFSTSCSALRSL